MLANVFGDLPHAAHARGKFHQVADVDFHRLAAVRRDKYLALEYEASFFVVIGPWKFRNLFRPDWPAFDAHGVDLLICRFLDFYLHDGAPFYVCILNINKLGLLGGNARGFETKVDDKTKVERQ